MKHSKGKTVILVSFKRCTFDNCTSRAYYGLAGYKMNHCTEHKMEGERRSPNKRCIAFECRELATHGSSVSMPLHCKPKLWMK